MKRVLETFIFCKTRHLNLEIEFFQFLQFFHFLQLKKWKFDKSFNRKWQMYKNKKIYFFILNAYFNINKKF